MSKQKRLSFFLCVALLQVSVPLYMILAREQVLHQGEVYRFKTSPVDPYDAFRGRYVALDIDANQVSLEPDLKGKLKHKQIVYLELKQDLDGFSTFGNLFLQPPAGAHLKVKIDNVGDDYADFLLPFDRYYIEETLALQAERAYNQLNRSGFEENHLTPAYLQVRILNGKAVLEELYLAEKPVHLYLDNPSK